MPAKTKTQERETVDYESAIAMLPDGDYVHTFRNPAGGMMIGADWDREDILSIIKKHGAELSGSMATSMDHGLVVFDDAPLFIATRKALTKATQ